MLAKHPYLAALLSLVLAPGLGQLLTGRLLKGAVFMGLTALWLPVMLIKLGRDLAAAAPSIEAIDPAWPLAERLAALGGALAPQADSLTWFVLPLIVIWSCSAADAFLFALRSGRSK